jgi:hypothetical protein
MRPILLKGHERCVPRRKQLGPGFRVALSRAAASRGGAPVADAHAGRRPLTFLKYNAEGDLLMTCAKDHTPNLWYADDGERIGTYSGHNGAVWTCDMTGAPALRAKAARDGGR